MQKKITLTFIIFINFVNFVYADNTSKKEIEDLSSAYGFILGQNFTLDRIEKEFPEFSNDVLLVKTKFSANFDKAVKNISKKLEDLYGKKFIEYEKKLKEDAYNALEKQKLSPSIAKEYIKKINQRASGDLEKEVQKTFLAYQFIENPADEYFSGSKEKFSTRYHPKSKGLDIDIYVPKSWSSREGKRPNIIQFFKSNDEKLNLLIMVNDFGNISEEIGFDVNTLEGSQKLFKSLDDENYFEKIASDSGLNNTKIISKKDYIIDNWPSKYIEFTGNKQRLDKTLHAYMNYTIVIYKQYMIFIQFMVGKTPDQSNDEFNNTIEKFKPLMELIKNGVVINNQYY